VWVFWGGFFRWVYPNKPPGFFGYVPGCLNPGGSTVLDGLLRSLISSSYVCDCVVWQSISVYDSLVGWLIAVSAADRPGSRETLSGDGCATDAVDLSLRDDNTRNDTTASSVLVLKLEPSSRDHIESCLCFWPWNSITANFVSQD